MFNKFNLYCYQAKDISNVVIDSDNIALEELLKLKSVTDPNQIIQFISRFSKDEEFDISVDYCANVKLFVNKQFIDNYYKVSIEAKRFNQTILELQSCHIK